MNCSAREYIVFSIVCSSIASDVLEIDVDYNSYSVPLFSVKYMVSLIVNFDIIRIFGLISIKRTNFVKLLLCLNNM